MRRHLFALAVVGALGSLLASDASACCHKKRGCAQPTCAAPVAYAAPVCAPAPCAAPRKHCFGGMRRGGGLCHKRQQTCAAPVAYAAPACNTCATPVAYPTAQASAQY